MPMGFRRITMGDVSGVSKGNHYSDHDLDALKGNEKISTNAAINRVANHAGADEIHVLHGRDKTEGEIRSEHRDGVANEGFWDDIKEVGQLGTEHILEHLEMAGAVDASAVMLPVSTVLGTLEMMKKVGEDGIVGHERAEAMPRDAMHAVILGNLNGLPQGYVDGERSKLSNEAKDGSFAREMSRQLGRNDNPMMAIMQLHCDQGMTAARAMVDAKQTPSEYLATHADVAKKYTHDAAFRHGFDGAVFARDNGQYPDIMKALDARDARYEAHHVAWRG
jgi:hypothetical protein